MVDRGRLVLQDTLVALRAPTGSVVVRTPDPEWAVALLDGDLRARSGDRLVVRAADPAELNARLVRHGIRITELAEERRTLEEVVLAATSGSSDRVDGAVRRGAPGRGLASDDSAWDRPPPGRPCRSPPAARTRPRPASEPAPPDRPDPGGPGPRRTRPAEPAQPEPGPGEPARAEPGRCGTGAGGARRQPEASGAEAVQ